MVKLPKSTIVKMAKLNGVQRIDKAGTDVLVANAEKFIAKVSKMANDAAAKKKRKTVKTEDIEEAIASCCM